MHEHGALKTPRRFVRASVPIVLQMERKSALRNEPVAHEFVLWSIQRNVVRIVQLIETLLTSGQKSGTEPIPREHWLIAVDLPVCRSQPGHAPQCVNAAKSRREREP
jgi:hypothetical protein